MNVFFFILINNILPIFLLIFLGYFLAVKFELDIGSLNKINIYLFIPALVLVKLYQTEINLELLKAFLFALAFFLIMTITGSIVGNLRNYPKPRLNAFKNGVLLCNNGNYGLAIIALIFGDSPISAYAISVQIIIFIVGVIFTHTVGFYNAGSGQMNFKETLLTITKMPIIYVILLSLILKNIPYDISSSFLWPALIHLKNGMIPIALVTLGAQLSLTKFNFNNNDVYLASLLRLLGGPLVAYILLSLMGIEGTMARVLMIAAAVPSSVTSVIIAVEFNNEPDFASQIVMTTTFLSAMTVSSIILLTQYLF